MRQFFVILHRYVGLVMVLFLVVAGVTGTMLAFYDELEAFLHPEVMLIKTAPNQATLSPMDLAEQVERHYPNAILNRVPLHEEPGKPMRYFLQPKPNASADSIENNEIFIHPYTGGILAERKWGDISQGTINLMPFIYRLHFSLAVDKVGRYLFGIIGLLWTVDCFVGAYLTLPQQQRQPSPTHRNRLARGIISWCGRWGKSWKIRWASGFYKVTFDLHRAGGLWVWAMLFVFAWSSVAFNLTEVYRPVMKYLFASQVTEHELPVVNPPVLIPQMDKRAALLRGRELMQAASEERAFGINYEDRLTYVPSKNMYIYSVSSSLDVSNKTASTRVMFDANDGTLLARYLPTGEASGNTITEWLLALHTVRVWGLPMQILVFLIGMVVTGLSMTGVYLWWKKRSARMAAKKQLSRQKGIPQRPQILKG